MTLRKLCGNKMLLLSLVLVIIWLFLALISPWIVPQDPFAVHMEERLQAGSMIHWMGTDSLGRDEFSRILYGSRVTLGIAFCGVGLTAAFGIMIGASIAFAGGESGTGRDDYFRFFPGISKQDIHDSLDWRDRSQCMGCYYCFGSYDMAGICPHYTDIGKDRERKGICALCSVCGSRLLSYYLFLYSS